MKTLDKRILSKRWSVRLQAIEHGAWEDQVLDEVEVKPGNYQEVAEFIENMKNNDNCHELVAISGKKKGFGWDFGRNPKVLLLARRA